VLFPFSFPSLAIFLVVGAGSPPGMRRPNLTNTPFLFRSPIIHLEAVVPAFRTRGNASLSPVWILVFRNASTTFVGGSPPFRSFASSDPSLEPSLRLWMRCHAIFFSTPLASLLGTPSESFRQVLIQKAELCARLDHLSVPLLEIAFCWP